MDLFSLLARKVLDRGQAVATIGGAVALATGTARTRTGGGSAGSSRREEATPNPSGQLYSAGLNTEATKLTQLLLRGHASGFGQFKTVTVKPLAPFLTVAYILAQRILSMARSSAFFPMQKVHIARQAMHLVILLNDSVDENDEDDDLAMTIERERLILEDELRALEKALKRDLDDMSPLGLIHEQFFRQRTFYDAGNLAANLVFSKMQAYDLRVMTSGDFLSNADAVAGLVRAASSSASMLTSDLRMPDLLTSPAYSLFPNDTKVMNAGHSAVVPHKEIAAGIVDDNSSSSQTKSSSARSKRWMWGEKKKRDLYETTQAVDLKPQSPHTAIAVNHKGGGIVSPYPQQASNSSELRGADLHKSAMDDFIAWHSRLAQENPYDDELGSTPSTTSYSTSGSSQHASEPGYTIPPPVKGLPSALPQNNIPPISSVNSSKDPIPVTATFQRYTSMPLHPLDGGGLFDFEREVRILGKAVRRMSTVESFGSLEQQEERTVVETAPTSTIPTESVGDSWSKNNSSSGGQIKRNADAGQPVGHPSDPYSAQQ